MKIGGSELETNKPNETDKSLAEAIADAGIPTPPQVDPAESIVGDANFSPAPAEARPPSAEIPQPDKVIYTCHPLERFSIGPRWRFERGQLALDPDEAAELDKFLADKRTDSYTKRTVRKIDPKAAEAFLTKHLATVKRGAVESADALNQAGQLVGTKAVKPEE